MEKKTVQGEVSEERQPNEDSLTRKKGWMGEEEKEEGMLRVKTIITTVDTVSC
jgi:hypothetical protein